MFLPTTIVWYKPSTSVVDVAHMTGPSLYGNDLLCINYLHHGVALQPDQAPVFMSVAPLVPCA